MMRQFSRWALGAGLAMSALFVVGCSTVDTRISKNKAAYDQLPAKDQSLVSQGKISSGMSEMAVYMAWGQPQQKASGLVHNTPTETWVYTYSTSTYGPYYGGYGPGLYGDWGFAGPVAFVGHRGRYRFYGSYLYPWWDPYYSPFGATIQYPVKMVSFQKGRVVAFQFMSPGY